MPKGVFRIIMASHNPPDKAPIIIDIPGQSAFRSNEQVRKHLLCSECEAMFSRNGEGVVIPQCAHGQNQFPLLDAMKAGKPTDVVRGKAVYNGWSLPPEIDATAYQYFATSIFWRGSVTRWRGPAAAYFNALRPRYQEAFRWYLLGKAEFPREARVLVFVDYQDKTRGLVCFPAKARDEMLGRRILRHSFVIPGIKFVLMVGRGLASFPDVGSASTDRITLFEWRPVETEFERALFSHMGAVRPKGSVAVLSRRGKGM